MMDAIADAGWDHMGDDTMDDELRARIAAAEAMLRTIPEYDWLTKSNKLFWRSSEIAEIFGIDSRTVIEWCTSGLIEGATGFGEKLGWRMPRSGLLLFFAERVRKNIPPAIDA
jgi:hypothetical protein